MNYHALGVLPPGIEVLDGGGLTSPHNSGKLRSTLKIHEGGCTLTQPSQQPQGSASEDVRFYRLKVAFKYNLHPAWADLLRQVVELEQSAVHVGSDGRFAGFKAEPLQEQMDTFWPEVQAADDAIRQAVLEHFPEYQQEVEALPAFEVPEFVDDKTASRWMYGFKRLIQGRVSWIAEVVNRARIYSMSL